MEIKKKRYRSKVILSILAGLLVICSLSSCGGNKASEQTDANDSPSIQKAQEVLQETAAPTDQAGLNLLRQELDNKLAETDTALANAGLSEDGYYRLTRDEVIPDYINDSIDEGINELANLSGSDKETKLVFLTSDILELWSTLDELGNKP